ncbi:MAG: hypothetical protein H6741_12705 [Alphaproteobacteria bacterium]|nr:hypothetical protein [Alphaproteobacteria bacterium]
MSGSDLPARPATPAPRAGLEALLEALSACTPAPLEPPPKSLLDLTVTAREARRFKIDVSFSLAKGGAPLARWSVNDKGEPEAFRARLRATLPALGLPAEALERFFAISPPGEVQTTLSVKWGPEGGLPERVGLYYEELMDCPRAEAITAAVFDLVDPSAKRSPIPGALPGAVSADLTPGGFIGARDYLLCQDDAEGLHPGLHLPPEAEAFRAALPLHSHNHTRRFLVARRAGAREGSKLLWLTEAHHPSSAERAWAVVDALRVRLELPDSLPARAMDQLRATWPLPLDEAYPYPDLVCLNLDGQGAPEALILYVSIK